MSSAAVASVQEHQSAFQPMDVGTPEGTRIAVFLSHLIRQTASWSLRTWQNLPRKTRLLLTGLLMTSCSFGLSMIVSVLSH